MQLGDFFRVVLLDGERLFRLGDAGELRRHAESALLRDVGDCVDVGDLIRVARHGGFPEEEKPNGDAGQNKHGGSDADDDPDFFLCHTNSSFLKLPRIFLFCRACRKKLRCPDKKGYQTSTLYNEIYKITT